MTKSNSHLFLLSPSTQEQLQTVFVGFLLRSMRGFPSCAIPLASFGHVRCSVVTQGSLLVTFVIFKQRTCLTSRPLLPSVSDPFSCLQPQQHVVSLVVTTVGLSPRRLRVWLLFPRPRGFSSTGPHPSDIVGGLLPHLLAPELSSCVAIRLHL